MSLNADAPARPSITGHEQRGQRADAATTTPGAVRQRLCIVVPTAADHDSRVHRIAAHVAARGHDVVVLARTGGGVSPSEERGGPGAGYRVVRTGAEAGRRLVGPLRIVDRAVATWRQLLAARAADTGADLYHGMAFMGIPVALDLARRRAAPVVYDARDLYADARSLARLPRPFRWIVRRRERAWARRADAVVTVNAGLAAELAARFAIDPPTVVANCPPRWTGQPGDRTRFHDRFGLPRHARVVLYHGGLEPERGIEQLLAARDLGDEVHLVFLGYGRLRASLEARLAADPGLAGRVHVMDAVPPEDLLPWVHGADVVAVPIQPSTLNHRLSTPNKLFEALGAGVPVVASDFPAMRRIVLDDPDGPLGAVCDPTDPVAIATAIRSLLDLDPAARADLRARCLRAAHARYAWETQLDVLLGVYGTLTGRPW